jgi:hypothetical protein
MFGFLCAEYCQDELGLESGGALSDDAFSASSSYDPTNVGPRNARYTNILLSRGIAQNGPQRCRWRLLGQLQLWSRQCRAQECQVSSILWRGIAQNGPQRCRWRLLGQLQLWSHQCRAQECQVYKHLVARRGIAPKGSPGFESLAGRPLWRTHSCEAIMLLNNLQWV